MASYWCCASSHVSDDTGYHRLSQRLVQSDFAPSAVVRFPPFSVIRFMSTRLNEPDTSFGRTHRSDQAVPPEYVLLSTELGGEKRFSSTIARRLGSLGALTKGDRGAADNGDLAKYNFETEEGRAALSLTLR
jgi:hypothetical protein